jgi:hypothetical protein
MTRYMPAPAGLCASDGDPPGARQHECDIAHEDTVRQALAYAARGWPVLPVHSVRADGRCTCSRAACTTPGKHPRTRQGVHDATSNEHIIRDWWHHWPDANIGIAVPAGLLVLDVDGPEGRESLQGLSLPPTIMAETGGGGLHYWYRLPAGVRVENTVRLAPGLDVRTKGCYVVAPPSVHRSGARYRWADCCAPEDVTIADAPAWLLDLLATHTRARPPLRLRDDELIPKGRRNNYLASLGGRCRDCGLTRHEITAVLLQVDKERCAPSLGTAEVHRVARSMVQYPTGPVRVDRRLLTADLSDGALLLAVLLSDQVPEEEIGRALAASASSRKRWWAELRAAGLEEVARTRPRRRFAIVPRGALYDPELSRAARVTLLHLAAYFRDGRACVSQGQLAKRRGRHRSNVGKDLQEAVDHGYLLSSGPAPYCPEHNRRLAANVYRWPEAELRTWDRGSGRKCAVEAREGGSRTTSATLARDPDHQHYIKTKAVPPSQLGPSKVVEGPALRGPAVTAPQGAGRRDCAVKRRNGSEESLVSLSLSVSVPLPLWPLPLPLDRRWWTWCRRS